MTGKFGITHSRSSHLVCSYVIYFAILIAFEQDGTGSRKRTQQLYADANSVPVKYYELGALGFTNGDKGAYIFRCTKSCRHNDTCELFHIVLTAEISND